MATDIIEIPSDSGFAVVGKTHEYQYLLRMDKYGDTLWTKRTSILAFFILLA
ncbi:MAG: hypothetical protein IPO32_18510 [Crocinitomicaceae bacterium]|nr:hypothetical protein [Crocinitomicaceae bacterium]